MITINANDIEIVTYNGLRVLEFKSMYDSEPKEQVDLTPSQKEQVDLTPSQIADILETAADLLETNGWVQGNWAQLQEDLRISRCAVGAIRRAGGQQLDNEEVDQVVCRALVKDPDRPPSLSDYVATLDPVPAVIKWNDRSARTAFEVIDLFRNVAKNLRNQAEPVT